MLKAEDYPIDGWAEKYVAIGEARGEAREGVRILEELLTERFGAVSDEVAARIRAADSETRHRWIKRFVAAKTMVKPWSGWWRRRFNRSSYAC